MVRPDAMSSAAAHVSREYGYTGYRLGVELGGIGGGGIFLVHHADGSEFRLLVDPWGNVDRLPDDWAELSTDAKQAVLDGIHSAREARMSTY